MDTHDPRRDALHMQLLSHNAFVLVMLGSVAFIAACVSVMWG